MPSMRSLEVILLGISCLQAVSHTHVYTHTQTRTNTLTRHHYRIDSSAYGKESKITIAFTHLSISHHLRKYFATPSKTLLGYEAAGESFLSASTKLNKSLVLWFSIKKKRLKVKISERNISDSAQCKLQFLSMEGRLDGNMDYFVVKYEK